MILLWRFAAEIIYIKNDPLKNSSTCKLVTDNSPGPRPTKNTTIACRSARIITGKKREKEEEASRLDRSRREEAAYKK